MHLLHIVPLGINGGASQAEKYLSYYECFQNHRNKVKYTLLFVAPIKNNFKLSERSMGYADVYIHEVPYTSNRCSMKRLIDNSLSYISLFLDSHSFTQVILRLELVDKKLVRFIDRYKPVIEIPSYPLEENTPHKPLYTKLAQRYMTKALKYCSGAIITVSYFFDFYPEYKKKFYLMPNSLLESKYSCSPFLPFDGKTLNLMLLTTHFVLGHYSAYERLLIGMNQWFENNEEPLCNLYVFGDADNNLKKMISTLNLDALADKVTIVSPGYLPLTEINNYTSKVHLGINDLGVFRKHSSNIADTIKTVDFIGWGLPFILSHHDENLEQGQVFYKTMKAAEDPIDFKEVIDFASSITPTIIEEEKNYQSKILMNHRVDMLIEYLYVRLKDGVK